MAQKFQFNLPPHVRRLRLQEDQRRRQSAVRTKEVAPVKPASPVPVPVRPTSTPHAPIGVMQAMLERHKMVALPVTPPTDKKEEDTASSTTTDALLADCRAQIAALSQSFQAQELAFNRLAKEEFTNLKILTNTLKATVEQQQQLLAKTLVPQSNVVFYGVVARAQLSLRPKSAKTDEKDASLLLANERVQLLHPTRVDSEQNVFLTARRIFDNGDVEDFEVLFFDAKAQECTFKQLSL